MGELLAAIHEATPKRTTREWLELCRERNIPAAALLDLSRLQDDPYIREQSLVTPARHPTEGPYFSTLSPIRMSESPVSLRRHAPRLGQNTVELLSTLGYSQREISELVRQGVAEAAQ